MPDPAAIPVSVHGVTLSAVLIGVLNLLVGGALVSWIRSRAPLREIEQRAEDKLRDDLIARVEKLEMKIDDERDRYERLIAILRHRLNNSDQCLDALLLLIESSPERVAEAVVKIKAMRSEQRVAEAAEKAAFLSRKAPGP